MEATHSSKLWVITYLTKWHYNPEDCKLDYDKILLHFSVLVSWKILTLFILLLHPILFLILHTAIFLQLQHK